MQSSSASTSSPPLISVIVPTYNYGHLINNCLDSVLSQTYQNWECIVVDDGSTDNTSAVVKRYSDRDSRVKYIVQDNRRQASARNNGIRNSTGRFLQFLDADDMLESRKLERQVEFLAAHPEVDIVYGDVRFFRDGHIEERHYLLGGEDKPWMPGISGSGEDVLLALVRKDTIPINTPLVRKRVIEKVGVFDEGLAVAEDWDFWIRCAAMNVRFQYQDLKEASALVRYHALSSSKNPQLLLNAILAMRKKIMAMDLSQTVLRLNKELAAEEEGQLGIEGVLHGNLARGIYQLCRAGFMDRKIKHKVKWFICALIAPFTSKQYFRKAYSSSLSGSMAKAISRLANTGQPT
jgi:glycosyltransferase involved in cell wall biosynthesis